MGGSFSCRGTLEVGKGFWTGNWHFGKLTATSECLSVSAPVAGELSLKPSDVIAIEAFRVIPILYRGIQIKHLVSDYPRVIRFRSFVGPGAMLRGIADAGFVPCGREQEVCLSCGEPLQEGASTCSACGWTYARPSEG